MTEKMITTRRSEAIARVGLLQLVEELDWASLKKEHPDAIPHTALEQHRTLRVELHRPSKPVAILLSVIPGALPDSVVAGDYATGFFDGIVKYAGLPRRKSPAKKSKK